jgi:YbgC/YbaW family acyl-CoA thioester hydrolase
MYMLTLPTTLESTMLIRFHDCDPFNHLNNSRYLDYIMTARGDQLLEHYQFDIYALARTKGIGWVTAQTQIAYINPALLMERVVIQTCLRSYSDRSLRFEATMWNENKTQLKALLETRLVHYNLQKQKSQSHDAELMEFFSRVVNPSDLSFEERLLELRQTIA